MVAPERSRKGGAAAARRCIFASGFLLGSILTCTITMSRLMLLQTGAPPKLESKSAASRTSTSSLAASTAATSIAGHQQERQVTMPSRDNWVLQSHIAKIRQQQQQQQLNSHTTTTLEEGEFMEKPFTPKTQTTQLTAAHERLQIPKNTPQGEETTTMAKYDNEADEQQQAAVAVNEQNEYNARNENSSHDVVDMENDKLQQERDTRMADTFQALLDNSEISAGARPGEPVATNEKHDEETIDRIEKNEQHAIKDEKNEIDTIQNAVDPGLLVLGKTKENDADGLEQEEDVSKGSTNTAETRDTTDYTTKIETNTETASDIETTTKTTSDTDTLEIQDFVKQPGVVIGIKIHGPAHVIQLKQSLCLLKAAYNNRLNYDILLFVTEALSNNDARDLKELVHPAHLIIETDKQTLSQQIAKMTRDQKQHLLQRCGKNSTDDLFWWTRCCDEDNRGDCMPLAYNWQAEFRSKWIWYSKSLAKYKWMMWYDSDAMATKVWQQDPVAFAIRHQLKMLFDHFPQGFRAHSELRGMMEDAYSGDYICDVKLVNGQLQAFRKAGGCNKPKIPQIHGFFHITDLDFYRSEANLKWFNNMIGDLKFTRTWDDQLAVTVPAAVLAANKSWEMNSHGIVLDIYHNQHFDGDIKRRHRGGGFVHWWENNSNMSFPEAIEDCSPFVKNSG